MSYRDDIYSNLNDISDAIGSIEYSLTKLNGPESEFIEDQVSNLSISLDAIPFHDNFTNNIINGVKDYLKELLVYSNSGSGDKITTKNNLRNILMGIEIDTIYA